MADTRLKYAVTSDISPIQVSPETGTGIQISLTVKVKNESAVAVEVKAIQVKIPVGTGGSQLTNDTTKIVPLQPTNWKPTAKNASEGFMTYVFQPETSFGKIEADHSVNLILNAILVNKQPGDAVISITEITADCSVQQGTCPVSNITLEKLSNVWGPITFEVKPAIIPYEGAVTLEWKGPPLATYSIQYYDEIAGSIVNVPAQGEPKLASDGKYPGQGKPGLKVRRTRTFYLDVMQTLNGKTYKGRIETTVTAIPPPLPVITSFGAKERVLDFTKGGKKVELTWVVNGATRLELSGGMITDNNFTGKTSYSGITDKTTMYALKAFNSDDRYVQQSILIQSVKDFLVLNTFVLRNQYSNEEGDFDGIWRYEGSLEEQLHLYADNTGHYSGSGMRSAINLTKRERHDNPFSWDSDLKWTMTGNKISITTKGSPMSVELNGSTLKYGTPPADVSFDRSKSEFYANPVATRKQVAIAAELLM